MSADRHAEYLHSMGIDVWVLRGNEDQNPAATDRIPDENQEQPFAANTDNGFVLGPGSGDILLMCRNAAESASQFAADVARSLDCEPVWSWPALDENEAGLKLQSAIEDRLITRVLVFGSGLFEPGVDSSTGPAHLIQVESMNALMRSGAARKTLWSQLYEHKWSAERARKSE